MNYLDNQLKNVSFADLSNFDEATGTYTVPKYTKPVYLVGKYYIVQLDKTIVNNVTSVLATNWNHGTAPKSECLKIFVNNTMGTMIRVDSLAHDMITGQDQLTVWSGWLDINMLDQIQAL